MRLWNAVRRLKNARLFDGWRGVKGAGERAVDFLAESPPDVNSLPKGSGVRGLVQYLRRCTEPEDRVLVSWFAPEVAFVSGRGFAGDRAFFLPELLRWPAATAKAGEAIEEAGGSGGR